MPKWLHGVTNGELLSPHQMSLLLLHLLKSLLLLQVVSRVPHLAKSWQSLILLKSIVSRSSRMTQWFKEKKVTGMRT